MSTLDHEIRLAKAKCAAYVLKCRDDPNGGTEIQQGENSTRIRLHVEVVQQWIEIIRRLLEARSNMLREAPAPDADLEDYESWVGASRSGPEPSPSALPSSPEKP